jgi:hypothetical protein
MPVEEKRKRVLKIMECFKSIVELQEVEKDRRILSLHFTKNIEKKPSTSQSESSIFPRWYGKKVPEILRSLQQM